MVFLNRAKKLNIRLLCPCHKLEVAVKERCNYGGEGQKSTHVAAMLSLTIVKSKVIRFAVNIRDIHTSLAMLFQHRYFIRFI